MSHLSSDYDYFLPQERIAQTPMQPRDQARLLVIQAESGLGEDRHICDLPEILQSGDLLVVNDTKVMKARTMIRFGEREHEVLWLGPCAAQRWKVLIRGARYLSIGEEFEADELMGTVVEKREDGVICLQISLTQAAFFLWLEQHGSIPLPPYITPKKEDESTAYELYQTVYAKTLGSVAAPTAGRHFTPALLERLRAMGVDTVSVTLHVGIGTFRPLQAEQLDQHKMHAEQVVLTPETVEAIARTRTNGGNVIAVGTTVLRTLEGVAKVHNGVLPEHGYRGEVNLFIRPGFAFCVVDRLLTNFHLPKSTLFVLVSALLGRERCLQIYEEAIRRNYRFFSFGDAMLLDVPNSLTKRP